MIKRFILASGDSFETGGFACLSPITTKTKTILSSEGVFVQEVQTLQYHPATSPAHTEGEWDSSGIDGPAKAAPVPGRTRELSLHGATAAMPVLPPCLWLVSAIGTSKISLNFEINSPELTVENLFFYFILLFSSFGNSWLIYLRRHVNATLFQFLLPLEESNYLITFHSFIKWNLYLIHNRTFNNPTGNAMWLPNEHGNYL